MYGRDSSRSRSLVTPSRTVKNRNSVLSQVIPLAAILGYFSSTVDVEELPAHSHEHQHSVQMVEEPGSGSSILLAKVPCEVERSGNHLTGCMIRELQGSGEFRPTPLLQSC
jgi:hypothetical protein